MRLATSGHPLLVEYIDALRAAVGLTRRGMPFHADAWVVLPDHMHCVWTLAPGDTGFDPRWRAIRSRFVSNLPRDLRDGPAIWAPRATRRPIDSLTDYAAMVRKCWFDPVRHGLARRPEDWEFSSVHREDCATQLVA